MTPPPTVSIVFLVFNRREELRVSLDKMLAESDYPAGRVEVIVVDNASTDGSGTMVREEFPGVRLLTRASNAGVSGWNDGFAVATGDYVLALDDDCYLPPDGLRRAVAASLAHDADLVSFSVAAAADSAYLFNDEYDTGMLAFWGCAVLMRRRVLEALGGYDPGIFVWANEIEFMMRFFDEGFRHLYLPEVRAVHMKPPAHARPDHFSSRGYVVNTQNLAYAAGKRLRLRDAAEALVAMLAISVRDAIRLDRNAIRGVRPSIAGFGSGLRHRDPVRSPAVSRAYRLNFQSYASPWWWSRPPSAFVIAALTRLPLLGRLLPLDRTPSKGRWDDYFAERPRFYPGRTSTLKL